MATSESKALTVADVEELAKSLGTLSDEELGKLKTLLCPSTVTAELGLKGILQSWIKNEPNPTREKLLQQTRKLQTEVNIPLETAEPQMGAATTETSLVSRVVGAFSGPLKYLAKGRGSKELIEACGKGDRATVSSLLSRGIKPNQIRGYKTPLLAASLMGHLDIVKDLLEAKADVQFTRTGIAAQPPLNAASSRGHYEVVELLLDSGASVNAMDGEEQTALHEAAFQGHPRVAQLLIERGADINKQSDDGSTPLIVASSGGDVETVKLLLAYSAETSVRIPKWGRTALHSASTRGHTKVVELLLRAADFDINDGDADRITPLMFAAIAGRLETVGFLVNAGANLNAQAKTGKTALIYAVTRDRLEEARVLVEAGANVDIQEYEKGWSAIFFAVEKGDMPMSLLLCESGANLDLAGKNKKNALDVAKKYSPTMYKMLLEAKTIGLEAFREKRNLGQKSTEVGLGHEPTSEEGKNDDQPGHEPTSEEGKDDDQPGHEPTSEEGKDDDQPGHEPTSEEGKNDDQPGHEPTSEEGKDDDQPGHEPTSEEVKDDNQPRPKAGESKATEVVPSYYKFDERYPGIRFVGNPWRQSVTSDGALIDWGQEIGIEFDIPAGAVPTGKQLDLCVWPCSAGPFRLPEEYELASPVYLVTPSFKFLCDITLTLYHFCAVESEGDCTDMVFLSSSATPHVEECQEPQYQFRVLSKGRFKPSEPYGSVSLKHFCNTAIGVKKDEPLKKMYAYQVYRKPVIEDMVVFSASLNQPEFFYQLKLAVEEHYPDTKLCTKSKIPINIHAPKLELSWPTDCGWEIIPDDNPEIDKESLDDTESVPYPPMIKLDIELCSSEPVKYITVSLVGTTEKKFFNVKPNKQRVLPMEYRSPTMTSSFSLPYTPRLMEGYSSPEQSWQSSSSSSSLQFSRYQYGLIPHSSRVHGMCLPHIPTAATVQPTSSPSLQGRQSCTMKDLLDNVKTVEWYRLGLELTRNETEMTFIDRDHRGDSRTALRRTFQLCLREDPSLSWPKVVQALRRISENRLAKRIEDIFCKCSDS